MAVEFSHNRMYRVHRTIMVSQTFSNIMLLPPMPARHICLLYTQFIYCAAHGLYYYENVVTRH